MDDDALDAGDFGAWLEDMQRSLDHGSGNAVPCGSCTACCTASQFVHIGPDEHDTLARIPPELLFPAPLLPRGQLLLGYDEQGRCPMLGDGGCTIYEHRPRTCRTYDCRVFTATGIEPDDDRIAARVGRWRFRVRPGDDTVRARAVLDAAARMDRIDDEVDDAPVPSSPTQRAVLAVEVHPQFVGRDAETGGAVQVTPSDDALLGALEAWSPVR